MVPGPVVKGSVRGKKATSERVPWIGSARRSTGRPPEDPEASACLRASRASGRLSCVQAEDITTRPPAISRSCTAA